MEIRNSPFEDRARQANQADITRPNRETIERSTLDLADKARDAKRRDQLELSSSRRVSERAERTERDAERAERVRELEEAHRQGELNTQERVTRTATRMLEGE